jgi:hypothetical protein
MSKNLNSAARLHRILEQAHTQADNTQTLEAWATLFKVSEPHPIKKVVAVGELVHAMHRELEIAASGLADKDFSKSLYENAFSRVGNALSPMLFPSQWNSVKQYLTPDTLIALAFCSEILPNEEAEISLEELAEISSKVLELKATLSENDLPARLRALILHHIELIERALADYQITGAKALREAGRTALGEMIEVRDDISAAQDSPAVSKLGSLWQTVNKAADYALKGDGLIQLGQRAWDALQGYFSSGA